MLEQSNRRDRNRNVDGPDRVAGAARVEPGGERGLRIALLGLVLALTGLQIFLREPDDSLLWPILMNAGHAPLYGLVSLAILRLLPATGRRSADAWYAQYVVALLLTVLVGSASEVLQLLGRGDADAGDIVRDILGASAFLIVAGVFDRRWGSRQARPGRAVALLLAALLLLVALLPAVDTAIAFARRAGAFPRICGFEDPWEETFVSVKEATLERVSPPLGWPGTPSHQVAKVEFGPGAYPGLLINEPWPDWSGYEGLVFEVYSELPTPIELNLRIHDIGHGREYRDRFNRVLVIQPGKSTISIPLREVGQGPLGRRLDLTRVRGLVLFADHPGQAFTLCFDDFRLE